MIGRWEGQSLDPPQAQKTLTPTLSRSTGRGGKRERAIGLSRGAFTLVELLVVVGIVAILAGVLAAVVIHLRRTAQTTGQRANFQVIDAVLKAYYQDFGDYPRNSSLVKWNTREGEATPAPVFYSLAAALLGPGPAVTETVHGEFQIGDGNDGPGFRSRSVTVFSGTADAEAGKATVRMTVDAADVAGAAAFAESFVAPGKANATRASIKFVPGAGQPLGETIGIEGVAAWGLGDRVPFQNAGTLTHPAETSRRQGEGGKGEGAFATRIRRADFVDTDGGAFVCTHWTLLNFGG